MLLFLPLTGFSQITLNEALSMARAHSPLTRVQAYSSSANDLEQKNINRQYLPQLSISGHATYQSDVITIPIEVPGFQIDALPKDQYRIVGEVGQILYDGRATHQQKLLTATGYELEQNAVELELEQNREQIIQLYFNILEVDALLRIVDLSGEDLLASSKILDAAIANGTALRSEKGTLDAALIDQEQRTIELQAHRAALIESMRLLIDAPIDATSEFVMPETVPMTLSINPEKYSYKAFGLQQQLLEQNYKMTKISSRPMLSLFGQGGYGNPGLDLLKNEFDAFYLVGVRAQWKFGNLYTRSIDRKTVDLEIQEIAARKEFLALHTDVRYSTQKVEIEKIQALASKDRELLSIRQQITGTARTQMENGVLNSADYLARFNEEKAARENLRMREIKLQKALYMLAHIAGNYSN